MRERGREKRKIDFSKEEIYEAIGVVLETSDKGQEMVEDSSSKIQERADTDSQMRSKRLGKRSIEKTSDRDQGKKKKGEEGKSTGLVVQKETEGNMEMVSEVSTKDSEHNEIDKSTD